MRCRCGHEILHLGHDDETVKVRTKMVLIKGDALLVVCPECRDEVQLGTLVQAPALRSSARAARQVRSEHLQPAG